MPVNHEPSDPRLPEARLRLALQGRQWPEDTPADRRRLLKEAGLLRADEETKPLSSWQAYLRAYRELE
jgi:hypothetical protein